MTRGDQGEEDIKTLNKALNDKPKFARLCIYTLNCFGNLAKNRTNLDRIAKEGSFKTIMNTMKLHPENARVISEGVSPLITACKVKEYAKKLGEEGAVEFCYEQLKETKDGSSKTSILNLLKSLIDGDEANLEKFKNLGGEEILRNILKESKDSKDNKLAAACATVLEKLTKNADYAREINEETIKEVVQNLETFSAKKEVAIPCIKILSNFVEANGDAAVEMLRKMNVVKLISQAIEANSTSKEVASLGSHALKLLSQQSDFEDALNRLYGKTIQNVEMREVVSLIGNLSVLEKNEDLIDDKKLIEKLNKIISKLIKSSNLSSEDLMLLCTTLQSVGKISGLNEYNAQYFKDNLMKKLNKLLTRQKLEPELLEAINVCALNLTNKPMTFDCVCDDKSFLPALLKRNKEHSGVEKINTATLELYKNLAVKDKGMKKLIEIGAIQIVCDNIHNNIQNSEVVLSNLETLSVFADKAGMIDNENIDRMIKAALFAMNDDVENYEVCKKAIEVLQKLAHNSQYACDQIAKFETMSVLSKHKNDTSYSDIKSDIDALKASLNEKKTGPVLGTVDYLKLIDDETKELKVNNQCTESFQKMFEPSEKVFLDSEVDVEKIRELNGLKILCSSVVKSSDCAYSETQDIVVKNMLKTIANLNKNGKQCEYLLNNNYYDALRKMYAMNCSDSLKKEIDDQLKTLYEYKNSILALAVAIDKADPDYNKKNIEKIKDLSKCWEVLVCLPEDIKTNYINGETEIDMLSRLILERKEKSDTELRSEAILLLTLINGAHPNNKAYFTKTYVESLCVVVKNNPDDINTCSYILGLLSGYESDQYAVEHISNLKNWYINRAIETDLEEMKRHLLNNIYEILDDDSKRVELNNNLLRLQYCYDTKNELYDINAEATEADKEVVCLSTYLICSKNFGDEINNRTLGLINLLVQNKNIEKLFFDSKNLHKIVAVMHATNDRATRQRIFMALSPFLRSENVVIHDYVMSEINIMLNASKNKSEFDRMDLLEDVIKEFNIDASNSIVMDECIDNILVLFKMQKTPEGKAKCIAIMTKMVKASDLTSVKLAEGEGLGLLMESLQRYPESEVYSKELTELTVLMAENRQCVPKMFEHKVDKEMKEIMFRFVNTVKTFHNAQRTIDLMNIASKNYDADQMRRWKQRSRIKQLMTELCRALGIMISSTLTKGERIVRTGDTAKDISKECLRILNEFGGSFDQAIEADSSTKLLSSLGEAWLLRANLMAFTFLVEKDVSARSILNAPENIEDTLVYACNYSAIWDFENKEFVESNRCVRGGIGHQSVRVMLDSSIESQPCQEVDLVTKEPVGQEYSLEDLIVWVKMDTEENNTLTCFNLILSWVMINWNLVTLTASIFVNPKNGVIKQKQSDKDGAFLSLRCGLRWNWNKEINKNDMYYYNLDVGEYKLVKPINKEAKGGLHIKVQISGEELRQKRREIKDTLDFSHSNVLSVKEKDELDFFIDVSSKETNCRKITKTLLKTKVEQTFIKFNQEMDGDLYFSWGDKDVEFEKRQRFNMKEIEKILEGKKTKTLLKDKHSVEDNCFSVVAVGDKEINIEMDNKSDRDIWVNGLKLVICTVACRKPSDMIW